MARFDALEKKAGYHDELAETLTIAADHFLAYRRPAEIQSGMACSYHLKHRILHPVLFVTAFRWYIFLHMEQRFRHR